LPQSATKLKLLSHVQNGYGRGRRVQSPSTIGVNVILPVRRVCTAVIRLWSSFSDHRCSYLERSTAPC